MHTVEEAVGANDNFAVRQLRKLGQPASRIGEALQAPKGSLRAVAKSTRSHRVVAMDVGKDLKERLARRRREPDSHRLRVLEELVRFAEDRVEEGAFAGLQLAFAAGERQEDLSLLLGLLVGVDAEHDGCGTAPLRDDKRLARSPNALQDGRRILAKI
jgi:hypothetical protein